MMCQCYLACCIVTRITARMDHQVSVRWNDEHEKKVLKHRHTWELLASLVQSSARDQVLRRGVLAVHGIRTATDAQFMFFYRCSLTWHVIFRRLPRSFWIVLLWRVTLRVQTPVGYARSSKGSLFSFVKLKLRSKGSIQKYYIHHDTVGQS